MSDIQTSISTVRTILYGNTTNVPLSDEDLISVIISYPAVLVAAADGVVDETERLFLLSVSEALGDGDASLSDKARLEAAERYRAFMLLLALGDKIEKTIINLIRPFCIADENLKMQISASMWGVAEASEGVSEVEALKIHQLSESLGIENSLN